MESQLLLQIEALYNLIEEKETEYFLLINSGCDYNTLQSNKANTEELKRKLYKSQELFLQQSLARQ